LSGRLSLTKEKLFRPLSKKDTLLKNNTSDQLHALLSSYNGNNKDEILEKALTFARNDSLRDTLKDRIESYCASTDKLAIIDDSISHYRDIMADSKQKRSAAEAIAKGEKKKLFDEFKEDKTNSFASDIYSLGIMFKDEFGMNLDDLGLTKMLSENPENRPSLDDIIHLFDHKLKEDQTQKIEKTSEQQAGPPLAAVTDAIRAPKLVIPQTLQQSKNGKLSLLSDTDMDKLAEIRKEKNNTYVQIEGKTVFLSKEGGAFALHGPMSSDAK
jgi:hypothetical protein